LGLGSGIPASEVRLALTGAKIVSQTTTRIRPDQGHIHLLVDGELVAMGLPRFDGQG
jgi:hypothetical protein